MVKLSNFTLNLGYPVYGARFVNNNTVIVAGGGGDGNNGIPNKMTAVMIQPDNAKKPIKRYRELTLNENEDSVMSLDVGNGTILAGINESSMMMSKGVNKHLRKFKFENDHLRFVESCQIHPNTNSTIYQKITAISNDGSVGVIVMSDTPSSVYIIESTNDLEEKFKIVTDGDVKDVTISKDGKLMCYITSNVFEVISLVTGRSVFKKSLNFLMSKIRFLDNNEVIISGSKDKDAFIAKFSISNSKIIQQKVVYKNMKGITSMDVNINNNLAVLATSNYSLLLIRTSDLKLIKVLNKVHEFAITKAVFNENGKYLVSTSAANTINVVEIPNNFAASKSILATIFNYLLSIIIIALLGIGTQFLYDHGYIQIVIDKAYEIYKANKPQDSSSYFTIESIPSFETTTVSTNNEVLSKSDTPATSNIITHTNFISDPILSNEIDLRDLTISDDIILSSEITTAGDYTISTKAFLDDIDISESTIESTDIIPTSTVSTNIIPTSIFTKSEFEPDTNTTSIVQQATSIDDVSSIVETEELATTESTKYYSTVEITESVSTSHASDSLINTIQLSSISTINSFTKKSFIPIKEITKEIEVVKEIEIIKEITSIITQTETQIQTEIAIATATATFTSTELITSVETSVSVETSLSVETSIVVQTVTKELIISKTIDLIPSEFGIQIEPRSEIFDNAIDGSRKEEENVVKKLEELEPETVTDTITKTVTEPTVEIQIEPSSAVFDDAVKGSEKEKENNLAEIESLLTSTIEETVNIAIEETVNIAIEPTSEVFQDAVEGSLKEEQKVTEELGITITSTIIQTAHVQVEPSTKMFDEPVDAIKIEENKINSELESKHNNRPSIISSITPIALFETEAPMPAPEIAKDEL